LRIGLTLAATAVGFCALGLFFSAATRNRWSALGLLYVVLLGILVAPSIALTDYRNSVTRGSPSILVNLYYLNPLITIAQESDRGEKVLADVPLLFGDAPFAAVTTLGYLFIAGIAVLGAIPFVNKIAASPPVPYEDLQSRV
jgi:hypothetical protein